MRYHYLFILFVFILLGCNHIQQETTSSNTDAIIDYSDYVHNKPRESLSEEELILFNKLEAVMYKHVTVKDNKFSINLDRDEFIEMGIPGKYHDLLIKDFADIDRFNANEESFKLNLDSSFQENKKEYNARIGLGK